MKRHIGFAVSALGNLLLVVAILFTTLQCVLHDDTFLYDTFARLDVAASMDTTTQELVKATRSMVDYMEGTRESISTVVTIGGVEQEMFTNPQEYTHMEDVMRIWQMFRAARNIFVIAGFVLLLLAMLWNRKNALGTLARGYLTGLGLALLIFGAAGVYAALDFDAFWTFFHRLLFSNSLWLFDPATSRMINMLPETFFSAVIVRFFLWAGALLALLAAASAAVLIKRPDTTKGGAAA